MYDGREKVNGLVLGSLLSLTSLEVHLLCT